MSTDDTIYYTEGLPVPETPEQGTAAGLWQQTDLVGKSIPRVDGYERVSGTAVYPSDLHLPNMLYAAILRCPHPHAMLKKVKSNKALKMPGVRAVITGESARVASIKWHYRNYEGKLFDPHCRFEGEVVAAVAADSWYEAVDAVRAIEVEYKVLPFVADYGTALDKNAAEIHDGGNLAGEESYSRGDIVKGFAEADVVLEQEYKTQCELHTPLELHGCVANWDGDRLTVWESSQGVYAVQSKVAEALELPLSKVRVVGYYLGGGFGSKLWPGKYTVICALLAQECGRPVKLFLTREETYLCVGNRPASSMRLKAGVKKDGTLTALEMVCSGPSGAYPAGGVQLVDWLARDLYKCENVRTSGKDLFINAGPVRPFRAPGHPQGAWALEQMMDSLAEAISMDPIELRLKNIPKVSQARDGAPPYTVTGLKECLKKGAEAFGWQQSVQRITTRNSDSGHLKRGVGVGACLWIAGAGGPPSTVIIKLFKDGSVNLNMGASDIGTGTKTVMALIVAEELGVKPEIIQIEHADTATTQYATPSGGSKTVPTESPTVRNAALDVKRQLLDMATEDLGVPVQELRYLGDEIVWTKNPEKKLKITEIKRLAKRGVVIGVGYRDPNPEGKAICPFAAQFCELEVNTKTGEIRLIRFLGVHDSGRVMDRMTFDSQVIGGIIMGVGFGLTEFRQLDAKQTGKLCNKNWHDYKLPTALDAPEEIVSLPVELSDPECNNTGAKGLGEPVTIPTAAAIANALYMAVGVRYTEAPLAPFTVINGLSV